MTLFNEEAQLDIHPIFPGVLKHTIKDTYNIYKHSIKLELVFVKHYAPNICLSPGMAEFAVS